jgi:hypothetical protein
MLHDLYLLTCYFEPTLAVMYEDDLKRRYGEGAIRQALRDGMLDFHQAPCLRSGGKCFYRLSQKGMAAARLA